MAYVVDIQFFNTFILRSTTKNSVYVEESRIKGGFNEPFAGLGPKAYITNENYEENRRSNALIYSGIYNSRTDVNKTNVFSGAEEITRAVDPANGSIQKLFAEDTNLNILQEDKVSYALIDKDAIFTAEGGNLTASGAKVIGQIVPYLGKYGISKNPESFAIKGNRKYFADKNRGAILRLSRDGITEISLAGMKDYFKDKLQKSSVAVGMYDDHNDEYVISLQGSELGSLLSNDTYEGYETLSFDENVKGWTSFYTFKPNFGFSVNKNFFTLNNNDLWKHHVDYTSSTPKNTFYNEFNESSITFVVNQQPSVVKTFNTINYEGSPDWEMKSSETDLAMKAWPIRKSSTSVASGVLGTSFVKKENKYYSHLRNNSSTTAVGSTSGSSTVVTLTAINNNIFVGQVITGTGIAAGTTVSAITGQTLTMSAAASLSNVTLTFRSTASNEIIGVNISGIKGFFTTVKMEHSSEVSDVELFTVSHNVVKSS